MCVFCQIIAGEIPCYKIYEDDKVFAFLDIQPVNPGHTLVIPRVHFQNLEEISEEYLQAVMLVVKKIGKDIKDKLGVVGYNVYENNDAIAGQAVPHLHFHVIPRKAEDGLTHWIGKEYALGEAEEIVKKLTV